MSKLMFCSHRLALLVCATFITTAANAITLRVIQGSHPLDEYAIGALRVALAQLDEPHDVEVRDEQMTQTRVIEELGLKRVDLIWLASNQEAEDTLRPIRFPLLKGLLGYRVNIINPAKQSKFSEVQTTADLQQLTFGQGNGWPDVGILRHNNLQVITTSKYESLFYMTEGGRFDGFPRGVLEPWLELQSHSELGLTVDKHLLMIYHLPFYFFVSPENTALADKIARGLELALANGKFDEYFLSHRMISGSLARAQLKERKVFNLQNPTLPKLTPLHRRDYWFDIESLQ